MSEERSPFEVYEDMFKAWSDAYSSWARSISNMPYFKTDDMERWFKPFWDYFGDWGKIYENFTGTMKAFPWPYEAMKDYSEAAAKGINSYVKIYDAWVRSIDKIGRKQLEIAQALATGKEAKTDELFDALKKAYDDVSSSLTQSLKGTALEGAFKGVEEINKAITRFADSFPEEEKQAKKIFQAFSNSFVKITSSWNTLMMEAGKTFSDMLAKGEISPDAYKQMVNIYGEISKESIGALLGSLSTLLPGYKDTVDDITDWANKYFDLITAWFEVPLKLSQGIGRSSSEMYKFMDETFKEGKVSSPEEFYRRWSEFYQKATADLMETTQFSITLPKFTNRLVEYVKSTNNLYRRIITPPFPSKEEMDKIYASMEELRKTAERKRGTEKKEEGAGGV